MGLLLLMRAAIQRQPVRKTAAELKLVVIVMGRSSCSFLEDTFCMNELRMVLVENLPINESILEQIIKNMTIE